MNQHFQPRRGQPEGHGRMKEQRDEDYAGDNGQPTLDQHAGAVARGIIKQTGVEDTTQIWRAVKRAYLTGYGDASR